MSPALVPTPRLEPSQIARRFLRGNVSLAASYLLALAGSVVLARGLAPAHFGMLAFAGAVATYAGLLSRWGTEVSLVRDMVRAGAGRGTVLRDAMGLRMRLAGVSLLAIAALSWAAFAPLKAAVVTAMVMGQLVLALDLGPLYDIEGRTSRHVAASTVRQGLYTVLAFACVTFLPADLRVAAVGTTWLLANVAFIVHCWREMELSTRFLRRAATGEGLSVLARRNLPAFASLVAHQCYVNLDLILISLLLGDEKLAPYAVASSFAQAGLGSTALLHRLLQPALMDGLGSARGPVVYRRCLRIAGAGSLLVGVGLLAAGPLLVRALYPAHMAAAGTLTQLLSAWVVLGGAGGIGAYALLGLGRDRVYLLSALAGAASNIALNFLLIPTQGIWGAAWATVISQGLASGLALVATSDVLLRPAARSFAAGPPARFEAHTPEGADD